MTTSELINYYANLLILQYLGKPKAYATIQTLVTPVIMDQLPTSVENAFNVVGDNPAIGVQLDVIGKYVGASRYGNSLSGPVTLTDDEFLTLIKFAIIRNSSSSSLFAIQALFNQFFPGEILVFDYANMNMSYLISSTIGDQNLLQVAIAQGALAKPMAVGLSIIIAPIITTFFGFRTYSVVTINNSPFNSYSAYTTDTPWLSYADAVAV